MREEPTSDETIKATDQASIQAKVEARSTRADSMLAILQ
jgi:hypothetical protein